jgi:hypothetical protein
MKKYIVLFAAATALFAACKAKHTAQSNAVAKTDSVATIADGEPNPSAPADSIRLNVSFYSPGNGVNYRAAKKLDAFLDTYELANPGMVTVYKTAWGREGEVDYCFKTTKLDTKKADDFVKQVMDLLKGEDRINFKENTTCRKPRN